MEKLNHQEEEAMLAVWKTGTAFVKEYYQAFPEPKPHYNTFASVLKNLERKGYIRQTRAVPGIEYAVMVAEDAYKKKFLSGIAQKYFGNSYTNMVAFFTQTEDISVEELKQLIETIEKNKQS